jgi:hypothetical protein
VRVTKAPRPSHSPSAQGHAKNRKRAALAVAVMADALQLGLFPLFGEGAFSPLQDALDVMVALTLLLTVGFRWRNLLAFGIELVPGVALFPTWTAMVATLPAVSEPGDHRLAPGRGDALVEQRNQPAEVA